jgi:hypothetical protein
MARCRPALRISTPKTTRAVMSPPQFGGAAYNFSTSSKAVSTMQNPVLQSAQGK